MLVLSRQKNQVIEIGNNIKITIVDMQGDYVPYDFSKDWKLIKYKS